MTAPRTTTVFAAVLMLSVSGHARENLKLNSSLVSGGKVTMFNVSSDGSWAVYLADQEQDGTTEIYSVGVTGGARTKLNAPLVANGDVLDFRISPDSARVVYLADQDVDGRRELYMVPIQGHADPTRLNASLVEGGKVQYDFAVSPDSVRVVYVADQESDGVYEVYSVPIVGGAVTKLNTPLVANGDMVAFEISPDSTRVVYLADQETDNTDEVFSVPIAGPAAAGVKLSPGFDIAVYSLAPDSARVLMTRASVVKPQPAIYSVPISGPSTSAVPLDGVWNTGSLHAISPDSSHCVYSIYTLHVPTDTAEFDLYSVPIAGPATAGIQISHLSIPASATGKVGISPDSETVVYGASLRGLHRVPITGPMSESTQIGPFPYRGQCEVAPGSETVVYKALVPSAGVSIFAVSLSGGDAVKLNPDLTEGGDVETFMIFPDGNWVGYAADQEVDGRLELYSVPITGPSSWATKVSGGMVNGGSLSNALLSHDGEAILYLADQETDETTELFVTFNPACYCLINGFDLGPTGMVIRVPTDPGRTYRVYYADDFADAPENPHWKGFLTGGEYQETGTVARVWSANDIPGVTTSNMASRCRVYRVTVELPE